jgi:hypothetical protein
MCLLCFKHPPYRYNLCPYEIYVHMDPEEHFSGKTDLGEGDPYTQGVH